MAERAGVDLAQLYEILTHATGDCVAVRTRLPAEGVVPDSPASNGWAPGFMTDLMAKDLDLAIDLRSRPASALHLGHRAPDPGGDQRGRFRARGLLRHGQGDPDAGCTVTVLTLDLGTTATKAALWGDGGLRAMARSTITTTNPRPGWAEQDPEEWWLSVVDACAQLRRDAPDDYGGCGRSASPPRGDVRTGRRRPPRDRTRDPLVRSARRSRGVAFRRPRRVPRENRCGAQRGVLRGEGRVGL